MPSNPIPLLPESFVNITITYASGKRHFFKEVKVLRNSYVLEIYHKDGHRIQRLTLGMWKEIEYKPCQTEIENG